MNPEAAHTLQVWMGAAGIFGGCVAAVWGLAWSLHNKIEQKVKERNEKISGVYRRLDECKTEVDRKYQPREVCTVLHKTLGEKVDQIEEDVREVKCDVKKLLGYANGGPKLRSKRSR